jgi:hypothetical protein
LGFVWIESHSNKVISVNQKISSKMRETCKGDVTKNLMDLNGKKIWLKFYFVGTEICFFEENFGIFFLCFQDSLTINDWHFIRH